MSNGKKQTSSIISNLYFEKNLILCSSLFSKWALFNCNNKSPHEMKYVETLALAAFIPMDVAKCVFPTPGLPI